MATQTLRSIPKRLIDIALQYGVIGLGLGTFLESLGIPFASLALPIAAGSLIESGRTTFAGALIVSNAGLVLGSIASYYIGYYGGQFFRKRHERPRSAIMRWFADSLDDYGIVIIAIAQLYGPARTWISIPAGAARMDIKMFIIGTAIGGTIYCALAISLSLALTRLLKDIERLFTPLANIYIVIAVVFIVAIVFAIYVRTRRNEKSGKERRVA